MVTVSEIKKLFSIFENTGIGEIEIKNKENVIRLKLGEKSSIQVVPSYKVEKVKKEKEVEKSEEVKPKLPEIYEVRSKWIGYFTRINPKTGENYIKLRDVVKEGDIVGHVSVLGVLQDVKVEKSGKIKEILVEEGQAIEYGQPILRIEVDEKGSSNV